MNWFRLKSYSTLNNFVEESNFLYNINDIDFKPNLHYLFLEAVLLIVVVQKVVVERVVIVVILI